MVSMFVLYFHVCLVTIFKIADGLTPYLRAKAEVVFLPVFTPRLWHRLIILTSSTDSLAFEPLLTFTFGFTGSK